MDGNFATVCGDKINLAGDVEEFCRALKDWSPGLAGVELRHMAVLGHGRQHHRSWLSGRPGSRRPTQPARPTSCCPRSSEPRATTSLSCASRHPLLRRRQVRWQSDCRPPSLTLLSCGPDRHHIPACFASPFLLTGAPGGGSSGAGGDAASVAATRADSEWSMFVVLMSCDTMPATFALCRCLHSPFVHFHALPRRALAPVVNLLAAQNDVLVAKFDALKVQVQHETQVMSKVSSALIITAMRVGSLNLTRVTASARADFAAFTWKRPSGGNDFSESEATPLLLAHFWAQLCAALPPSGSGEPASRVPLGLAAHCQLVDARTLPLSVVVVDAVKAVTTTVNGYPDAVLTDINASVDFMVASVLAWAGLVIDWKIPSALARATPQAILELIATRRINGEAVPVVLTDCSTRMHVWTLVGRVLTEYVSADGRSGLTLQEGCGLLTQVLMPAYIEGLPSLLAARRREHVLVEDGEEEEEDGGSSVGSDGSEHLPGGDSAAVGGGTAGGGGERGGGIGTAVSRGAGGSGASGAFSGPNGGGGGRRQTYAPLQLSHGNMLTYPFNEATIKDRTRRLRWAARELINPSVLPAVTSDDVANADTDG